jgi:predicted NBD/HSP70 family sugar kinase
MGQYEPQADGGGAPNPVRRHNRARILLEIRRVPGISRRQLAASTGLTDASVSRIVKDLISEGLVEDMEPRASQLRRGRRQVGLRIRPTGLSLLAICLSAYDQRISVIDAAGARQFEAKVPGLPGATPEEVAAFTVSELEQQGLHGADAAQRLGGISISVAGAVDSRKRTILSAPLIDWRRDAFGSRMEDALGAPVVLDNVANVLHLAELQYGDRGPAANSLLIHGASGLGASLIVNGALSRGSGNEGAINQMLVEAPGAEDGRAMRLGDIVSGQAILLRIEDYAPEIVSDWPDTPFRTRLSRAVNDANNGHPAAERVFRDSGSQLGVAVGAIAAVVQPERLILAGPLSQANAFARGVEETFRMSFCTAFGSGPITHIAAMSYHRATELVGLEAFLLGSSIDALEALPSTKLLGAGDLGGT